MNQRRWSLIWLLAGLGLVAWGAYCFAVARGTATLQDVDVAAIERGEPLPGRWLRLKGQVRSADRLIFDGGEFKEVYVPLVSPNWQPGQPAAVLVRIVAREGVQPGDLIYWEGPTVEGIVDTSAFDADARQLYDLDERKAAPNVVILDFQQKPDDKLAYAIVCLPVGGVLIAIGAGLWFFGKQETTS